MHGANPNLPTLNSDQLALVQLYLATFGRAPEKSGLDYWSARLTGGQSLTAIVNTVFSLDVVKAVYPDALPTTEFLTQVYANVFGKTPDAEGLAYWGAQLAAGTPRGSLMLAMVEAGLGCADGTPGKAFLANRYTVACHAVEQQQMQQREIDPALLQNIHAGVNADPDSVTVATDRIDHHSGAHVSGAVADGYIRNAAVFADTNGDGLRNAGEAQGISDGKGRFALTNAHGALIAEGGTDITTGQSRTWALKAVEGASVINPLTTLQQAFVAAGHTAAQAQGLLAKAFGFDSDKIDVSSYDPLAIAFASGGTDKNLALRMQALIAKLDGVVTVTSKVLAGVVGAENLSLHDAANAVLASLVRAIQADADGIVALNDRAFLGGIVADSAAHATHPALNAATGKIEGIAGGLAQVLADIAGNIDKASSAPATIYDGLAQLGKVQAAVQGPLAATLGWAAAYGALDGVVPGFTGASLEASIRGMVIADLDPNSTADQPAINTANAQANADVNIEAPDTSNPTLTSSNPADNATGVALGSNVVLSFSETVTAGTGSIVLTNAGNAADTRTIAIGDATQVTFSGNTVTINPSADLLLNGNYHVQIASGVIRDMAGNPYAGIANATTLNFATPVSVIALFSLNGSTGFRLNGAAAGDRSGNSVSQAGDINGDGFEDLLVGAHKADANGVDSGAIYVVFGKASGFASSIDLSSLDGSTGFRLAGATTGDQSGFSVSSAGDVNGDGFADLVMGARFPDVNGVDSGASYVLFGKASGFASSIDLSSLDGSNGFRLAGAAGYDQSGFSVSGAGDVNGDGFADLLVGAFAAGSFAGAGYLVFGKASGFASNFNLSDLTGSNGFRVAGAAAGDIAGVSVSGAGDVNGDGFDDLLVGASGVAGSTGSSYLVFGKSSGFASNINVASLDGSTGFRVDGVAAGNEAGHSVSAAGDVNGDGFADLLIGAHRVNANGTASGASYVVFGKAAFDPSINLASLDGSDGFRLDGAAAYDLSGVSVSAAGDVNGDGFEDLLVGAYGAPNGGYTGASYVVFGKASGFASSVSLSNLDGNNGFRLDGAAAGDIAGHSVSAAGDVNGDGFADLLVGAESADPNGSDSGASYVIFGGNFNGAVTFLGTDDSDSRSGTAAAERFVAGNGDDTLTGNGGADVFLGGAGNDTIAVADVGFARIDGGSGSDTLALAGASLHLDLSAVRNRIDDIEKIDLTGNGDNILTLSVHDVLNLSGSSNVLTVDGDAGDTVNIGLGWTDNGMTGSYHTYTQDAATLLIGIAIVDVTMI
ncbi:Ig-like domain-containing protein [Noviherbaspirillum saxi]|uniref:DUF4214 domain-containing protein n=1 Tax=Noviherbaspirillum saxi TaxID=2320863 RepID=A0A3A3GC92_9BURK|nr:Ig-like domain-containing protein [Noviherbaspirillum saxi]RJF98509.1 DUF4214 domain-containing protein [Noviherbaspirillum saxi]